MARISMDDLCGGALLQKFNMEMMKIGQNIMNPNTDAKKPRKLVISLTFKPDENRQVIQTAIATSSTLAPLQPINTTMLAGQDLRTGMINMSELGNEQNRLRVAGEVAQVQTEEIRPQRPVQSFDAETGEIYETGKPIDLRKSS